MSFCVSSSSSDRAGGSSKRSSSPARSGKLPLSTFWLVSDTTAPPFPVFAACGVAYSASASAANPLVTFLGSAPRTIRSASAASSASSPPSSTRVCRACHISSICRLEVSLSPATMASKSARFLGKSPESSSLRRLAWDMVKPKESAWGSSAATCIWTRCRWFRGRLPRPSTASVPRWPAARRQWNREAEPGFRPLPPLP